MTPTYFVTPEGAGMTPDGTIPDGAKRCSEVEFRARARLVDDEIVIPDVDAVGVAREQALAEIDSLHDAILLSRVARPTATERDTWPIKLAMAQQIMSGVVTPDAEAFIVAGDVEATSWAEDVIAKSRAYAASIGQAEKLRRAARKAVRSAETVDAVRAAVDAMRAEAELVP